MTVGDVILGTKCSVNKTATKRKYKVFVTAVPFLAVLKCFKEFLIFLCLKIIFIITLSFCTSSTALLKVIITNKVFDQWYVVELILLNGLLP